MIAVIVLMGAGFRTELAVPAEEFSVEIPGQATSRPWWDSFEDPTLSALVSEGLDHNLDVAAADARVRAAKARSWQSASPALPYARLDAGIQRMPCQSLGYDPCAIAAAAAQEDAPDTYTQDSLALVAGLNVDLFGATTNAALAARLEAQAAAGDAGALELLVSTRVAGAWWDLLVAREQLAIVEDQVELQEDLLEVSRLQLERGLATGLDVLQQQQQVALARAQVPTARAGLRRAEAGLAALLDRDPTRPIELDGSLPIVPGAPPTGSPADLLLRPDVAAASSRVEAARKREKSAARAALPSLGVSAQTGRTGQDILERDTVETWSMGASVSVPLFGGGVHAADVSASRAETDALRRSAEAAWLQAVQEVEVAVALDGDMVVLVESTEALLQASELAYEQARLRFAAGDVPYLQVTAAAAALYNARLSELSARRQALDARLSLHAALGR
ncbi:MAG TPA: TolC family protein [Myxococcota bacterium]|nr:TolC family protein [Myxococcota bacterium]